MSEIDLNLSTARLKALRIDVTRSYLQLEEDLAALHKQISDLRGRQIDMDERHYKLSQIKNQVESELFKREVAGEDVASVEPMDDRRQAAKDDPTITLGDEMDVKDIYLTTTIGPGKIKQIIGLHAVGQAGPYSFNMLHLDGSIEERTRNFMAFEAWGNEYDEEHNMLGRGSFRLNTNDIEDYAKELEAEGWVRCERPGKK